MSLGRFIVFEGSEGAGKTTNLRGLADHLESHGIEVVCTREPGGTEYAEAIRQLIINPTKEPVASMTELLLMFAARAQHLQALIRPSLEAGQWVLCDRFTDSTYAYQGAGRGVNHATIEALEHLVQDLFRPDWVILLDLPIEIGMQRARARGALDRFEQEQLVFFERVRTLFLERASQDTTRYSVVDATQPLEAIQADILSELERRFFS